MNNIDEFRDALAAHLLSKHGASDEQIEGKPLPEVVALHEHAHREGTFLHRYDSLEVGPLTQVFIFDLPVQVFGFSAADAHRRFMASGLSDGDAVIKQGAVQLEVVYINMDCVYPENMKFNYVMPTDERA